jgi:hypothetical protein
VWCSGSPTIGNGDVSSSSVKQWSVRSERFQARLITPIWLGRRRTPVPPEGCVLFATRVVLGRIEQPVAPGERGLRRLIGR